MSNILQKIKIPAIVLVVIIILFFGYTTLVKDNGNTSNLFSDSSINSSTSQADQDFLKLLLKIQNVVIDPTIFSDPAFLSLQDDGLPILDQPKGRPNPFAPIGTDSGSAQVATSSTNN